MTILSLREAASTLEVSVQTLGAWVVAGTAPTAVISEGCVWFLTEDVQDWLRSLPVDEGGLPVLPAAPH